MKVFNYLRHKKAFLFLSLFFTLEGCGGGGDTQKVSAVTHSDKVLILYDAPANQPGSKMGLGYAIMLRNLIGHFKLAVDLSPVQNYKSGQTEEYKATFYLGNSYNHPLPEIFLNDAAKTHQTLVWFKYNLSQLVSNTTFNFQQQFGFNFLHIQGFNATPSANLSSPGFFDTVIYKNQSLAKYYQYDASTNTAIADPDIGYTQIQDPAKAQALVPIKNSTTQQEAPYIIKSGNFWYFADIPLSFIGPRDRYLVLCDILHDILNIQHETRHIALVRFEDISFLSSATVLNSLSDYLSSKNIPFTLALIPFYRDPLGKFSPGNINQEVHFSDATVLKDSLNYALSKGGNILMHGYTHQYASTPNPSSAVSGDDFEFWNVNTNSPVTEDSKEWALSRIDAGLEELHKNGYTPFAWETPHYLASPSTIQAVKSRFSKVYQRVSYFTSDKPDLNATDSSRDYKLDQFFHYFIHSDYYGQTIIPENLGNVDYINALPQTIIDNAKYALVVRDGTASFFFHPFWLEPSRGKPGLQDFQNIVQGITDLGYQWVDPKTLSY